MPVWILTISTEKLYKRLCGEALCTNQYSVILVKTGIQKNMVYVSRLDSGVRRNDEITNLLYCKRREIVRCALCEALGLFAVETSFFTARVAEETQGLQRETTNSPQFLV